MTIKLYRFQTWVKKGLTGGTVSHRLVFYDEYNNPTRISLSSGARELPSAAFWLVDNGWQKLSGVAVAPPEAVSVRLEVVGSYIDGYVYFDDVTLEELDPGWTTTRSTYGLAGQPITIQVSTTNPSEPEGLYFIHTDHLGSVSAMSDESGNLAGNIVRFEPFGIVGQAAPQPTSPTGVLPATSTTITLS